MYVTRKYLEIPKHGSGVKGPTEPLQVSFPSQKAATIALSPALGEMHPLVGTLLPLGALPVYKQYTDPCTVLPNSAFSTVMVVPEGQVIVRVGSAHPHASVDEKNGGLQ